MVASRRGSGSVTLPSGVTMAFHTRTHAEEDLPHATKKYVARAIIENDLFTVYGYSGRWQIISGSLRACMCSLKL
jgi:hypothetical protein